jgi:hypothetical protein
VIDFFLGLIALGALTTVVVELVAIVGLLRFGVRLKQRADRIQRLAKPLAGHASAIRENLTYARGLAEVQLDRAALTYAAIDMPMSRVMTVLTVVRTARKILKR